MSSLLLSVVIQSYNYGHFISDAIDSIILQDFPSTDLELIIIDDASTDESPKIIQEYAKKYPYIRAIQYKENKGTHYSANHSIDLAKGEYIHWLAADDFRDKHFLRKSMDALLKYPDIGICCSDFGHTNAASGRFHSISNPLLKGISAPQALYPKDLLKTFQNTNFWIPGHTVIVRKDSIIKYGRFNKEFRSICDWFLFHQIALHEGVVYIPEALAYLYIHSNSYSAQISRSKETKKAVKAVLSLLDKKSFEQTRKLFYQAAILGWAYRESRFEFFKPKRWDAFFYLAKKKAKKALSVLFKIDK